MSDSVFQLNDGKRSFCGLKISRVYKIGFGTNIQCYFTVHIFVPCTHALKAIQRHGRVYIFSSVTCYKNLTFAENKPLKAVGTGEAAENTASFQVQRGRAVPTLASVTGATTEDQETPKEQLNNDTKSDERGETYSYFLQN